MEPGYYWAIIFGEEVIVRVVKDAMGFEIVDTFECYNGDFVELYSQPYRVGKTTKTTESERAELEAAVRNMGSSGYAIIDPLAYGWQDCREIVFLSETPLAYVKSV